jgi:hypothetical protein
MIDGFWILQIESVQGGGGGVVFFRNGKLFGGDNGYLYLGTYNLAGNTVTARVKVEQFLPGAPNLLGIEADYELDVEGKVESDVIRATGTPVGFEVTGLAFKLTRRAELD